MNNLLWDTVEIEAFEPSHPQQQWWLEGRASALSWRDLQPWMSPKFLDNMDPSMRIDCSRDLFINMHVESNPSCIYIYILCITHRLRPTRRSSWWSSMLLSRAISQASPRRHHAFMMELMCIWPCATDDLYKVYKWIDQKIPGSFFQPWLPAQLGSQATSHLLYSSLASGALLHRVLCWWQWGMESSSCRWHPSG